ncbi:MAG: type II secretion system protein [Patescibacteria group bacterium]
MNNKSHKKMGFTLLEMIVAMGVFIIAVLFSVGSLLSLTNAQKKALVLQSTQDNLRFALETIARDIRTGDFYYCGSSISDVPPIPSRKDCSFGGPSLTFQNVSGNTITYQMKDSRIQKKDGVLNFEPITSLDITVEYLTFYVIGSPDTDNLHPRVTIVAKGVSGSGSRRSDLNLQTTVSQRTIQR